MTASKQLYADNAKTTLSASILASDTTIPVLDASVFPSPINPGDFFKVTLEISGVLEIVYVYGKSGNSLTNCIRGREGKLASAFPSGTRVENRTTAATLASFVRTSDRLGEIDSVDSLIPPGVSDGNSYVCASREDSGNPIVAIKNTDTTWSFLTHPNVLMTGLVNSVTAGTLTSSVISGIPSPIIQGQYIVQFLTGVAAGYCKIVTSASGTTLNWGSALTVQPSPGDTFAIYRSTSSVLNNFISNSGDEAMIYSLVMND